MTAKKIIVGYDQSPDAHASASWALDEAARTGALVEFFYAYEWPTWAPAASMVPAPAVWPDGETDRAIKGMLHEAVTAAKHSHPTVRTTISIVNAGAALTLLERSAEASLIVLGSRGNSAVAGLFGSVSVAVTAHAHCPVVVVRDSRPAGAPVVVGVDDSASAQLALAFAFDQAAGRGAPLHLIRAVAPSAAGWSARPDITAAVTAGERRSLTDQITVWQDKYPQVQASCEVVVDHPARALSQAGDTAQLVVVGSHGRGALRGMVLGSVSQHVLRHCACTVAVVHEVQQA